MEEKKTPGADLENERSIFLLMGFVVVLSLLFVAFEWSNEQEDYPDPAMLSSLFVEEPFEMDFELPKEEQSPDEMDGLIENESQDEPQNVEIEGFDLRNSLVIEKEMPNNASGDASGLHTIQHEEIKKENIIEPPVETGETLAQEVDTLPEFPGGRGALIRYIYQNLKYPSVALKQRIQGKVICSFIVDENGSVFDVKLEKSVYLFLDEEAVRVLREMPKWNPGIKNGKGIKVKCYVPVVFKL